jgi:hypothetical protein
MALCLLMISGTFAQSLKPKKDKDSKKYGYINKAEEWVIKPTFDDADKFIDGLAKVKVRKLNGLINEDGQMVLDPQFDDIDKFKNGVAFIKKNKKVGFINEKCEIIVPPTYDDINNFSYDGIAKIRNSRRYGLLSINGDVLVEPRFDDIKSFTENIATVEENKLFGLIDKSGKVIFEPEFVKPLVFSKKGIAIAAKALANGEMMYGLVKQDGTEVIDIFQHLIVLEGDKYIVAKESGSWIVCNDNAMPLSREFEEFKPLTSGTLVSGTKFINDGIIAAKESNRWGFIDVIGKTVIPFQFEAVGSEDGWGFTYNLCAVKVGYKWGFIDKKGAFFKQPIYERVTRFVGTGGPITAKVVLDGFEYALNQEGKLSLLSNSANEAARKAAASGTRKAATSAAVSAVSVTSASKSTPEILQDWIVGNWKVIEERTGSTVKTGNQTGFISFNIEKGGQGTYLQRNLSDSGKSVETKMGWRFSGSTFIMSGVKYTVTPSADKKSMELSGMSGTYKLVKQ